MTMLGKTAWNKGKKFPQSKNWLEKRLAAARAAIKLLPSRKGIKRSREHVQPMIDARKKAQKDNPEKYNSLSIKNLPKDCNKEKNGNWKGGVTEKTRGMRFSKHYRKWRLAVLSRDGGKCRLCGSDHNIQVHHIIAISRCPEIAFIPMNGVVLCKDCHYAEDEAWQGKKYKPDQSTGKSMVLIFSIPHKFQAYPTCGNWQFTENNVPVIFVSQLSDSRYEFLIALHELVEVKLCEWCGITQKAVDDFDMEYEKNRPDGDESEPGDSPSAPYRFQHCLATGVERIVATVLGVDWKSYESEINALFQ